MRANCWEGAKHVKVEDVPDPKILNDRDAIVRVTSVSYTHLTLPTNREV